jgi:predicted secreted protein with PEFG-CTERM motif
MGIVLMAVALMSVTSVHQDVFAKDTGMSLTVTATEGSDTISITGDTASNRDVSIIVISPDGGNVVAVGQETPDANGMFSIDINCSNWNQNGMYSITASQAKSTVYELTLGVEVNDGMATSTSVTKDSAPAGPEDVTPEIDLSITGLEIAANAIEGSDTIGITGYTSNTSGEITFTVISPNGNLVSVAQLSPGSDGDFAIDITTGGPLWSQDGMYTVTATQGSAPYVDSVEVEIADGLVVPEFGTIAAMILAVAIISIIAVSAKSRLSIMPRY